MSIREGQGAVTIFVSLSQLIMGLSGTLWAYKGRQGSVRDVRDGCM